MYILTKMLQSMILLFLSVTLHIIPWIPSWTIESIVNFSSIGLFIGAGYLLYLIIKKFYSGENKPNVYLSTFYTFLLFTYLGGVAIIQIGVLIGKGEHLKTYEFKNQTFYVYQTLNKSTEVSRKDDFLPIRSLPLQTFSYVSVKLEEKDSKVYAKAEGIFEVVYDLN